MTFYTQFPSPISSILLTSDGTSLTGLYMDEYKHGEEIGEEWIPGDALPILGEATRQLAAYFEGALTSFDLPLSMQGTPFQQRVWNELTRIPYGTTISYGELARRIGNSNASRAVGLANGRNPISIIVPCHRVIGSNGSLTGYGGGLPRKAALLAFEASVLAHGPQALEMPTTEPAQPHPVQAQYQLEFVR